MTFLNRIFLIVTIATLFSACTYTKIVNSSTDTTFTIIPRVKFDSLVTVWLTKPFNLKDTSQVIELICIGNRLENNLVMQDTVWAKRDSTTIYNKFLHRYYTEFHELAYNHKDFVDITDSLQVHIAKYPKYDSTTIAYVKENIKHHQGLLDSPNWGKKEHSKQMIISYKDWEESVKNEVHIKRLKIIGKRRYKETLLWYKKKNMILFFECKSNAEYIICEEDWSFNPLTGKCE
jgi:hypothetical protein